MSNLYRDGYDRIDHHSDKDLDLNRSGVIVSVSLGSRRVMEVRDRQFPHDVARVDLPPGSMFVLGPETNARFTHAVLPMDDFGDREGRENGDCDDGDEEGDEMTENTKCSIEDGGRISLTFRDVRTFLDVKTQRLFGQGVVSSFDTPILVQDGVITEESLLRAVQHVRKEERRDGTKAIIVASVIGVGAGYVSCLNNGKADKVGGSDSLTEKLAGVTGLSLLRSISIAAISASASYCYHRYLRNEMRRRREEKDAREFFSKKSASGNKY